MAVSENHEQCRRRDNHRAAPIEAPTTLDASATEAAAARFLRPPLHRHRCVRGGRPSQAVVRHQRRDRARSPSAASCCAGSPSGSTSRAAPRCRCPPRGRTDRQRQQVENVFPRRSASDAGVGRHRRQRRIGDGADPLGDADQRQTDKLRTALFDKFQPKGADGKPSKQAISDSAVSETWGGQITQKALIALVVFLVLVGHLHHRALRALHGGRRAGDTGLRPRGHRGGLLTGRLRGHPGDGDRAADDPRASRCTTPSSCSTRSRRTPKVSSTPPGAPSPNRPTWRSTRHSCARSTPA